jgi:CRISPR/Cas system-associated exonuclease Cas4 (RecB family)
LEQLSATDIASFVRLQLCRRYLAFRAGRGKEKVEEVQRRFRILADPAYQEVGLRLEETVRNLLEQRGFQPAQGLLEEPTWPRWLEEVKKADPGRKLYAREVEISGQVGAFSLKGRIDFVLLLWENGVPKVRVLELKASRRNRSHHYVQLALYASLVKANPPIWQGQPVEVDYLVVRVDPGTMAPDLEDPRRPPTWEEKKLLEQAKEKKLLEQAIQDVEDLLKEGGLVKKILSEPDPFRIPYTLNARCDACGYNTVCLREAAERRDLELLSLPGDVVRGLREAGFRNLWFLARAQPGDERWNKALERMENPLPPTHLIKRAKARLAPLDPQLAKSEEYYPVQTLPGTGFGTLPPYEIEGKPLIRIYLVVEKDLVAERLNALVAHVTSGPEGLQLPEDPKVPLSLKDHRFVVQVRREAWSGNPAEDDAAEGRLIQDFFSDLVTQLKEMLKEKEAPLHFYVWSQADIKNLVEAILRVGPKGGSLLEALWHLMGCREGLEQLIFSSLADEVRTRYALGYTSCSLLTVTSLPFFGKPFPWHNLDGVNLDGVNSDRVNLKSLFHHWLFDFHHFEYGRHMEVRSRNYDAVPPVYWRFLWNREKEFPKNLPPKVRNAVRGAALFIPTYLQARSLALRWLEERVTPKNKLLKKPILRPKELPDFRLEARGVLRVARDFLRFEQQVRFSLWLADKTLPPALRVRNGTTLLLTDLKKSSDKNLYQAKIKADTQGFTLKDLEARFTLGPGDFVRVAPADDPEESQKTGDILSRGFTAVVKELNWTEGWVTLNRVPSPFPDSYVPKSIPPNGEWSLATMDPSPVDYVAKRVDGVLSGLLEGVSAGEVLDRWFDLERPELPPVKESPSLVERVKKVLEALGRIDVLNEAQQRAILEGFRHRIQVLQGPPGTGKTQTTAVAVLLWAQFLLPEGGILGVAAATHTAVDTLLERVQALKDKVREAFESVGEEWRPLDYWCLEPKRKEEGKPCQEAEKRKKKEEERKATPPSLLLLFGTTNGLLKANSSLKLLVVDEASMMPFPHFLALASLLFRESEEGRILLTGDHRQLAPVIQHQWEEEDRPGVQRYLPYLSAFEAMLRLREAMKAPQGVVAYSVLDYTHRLPQEVRLLIQPLYHRDGVELRGREAQKGMSLPKNIWEAVWEGEEGVYLFVHGERESRKRNPLEAEVILRILQAAPQVDPQELAVVTPFRAQRTLLRERLGERVGLVDTVERLQGGERKVIFYSASASDPDAITSLQEFLLDVNRTNVAFSRAKEKLVVVVAETLLYYIPPEQEAYEDAVLWKELRRLCDLEVGEDRVGDYWVRLLVPRRNVNA